MRDMIGQESGEGFAVNRCGDSEIGNFIKSHSVDNGANWYLNKGS